MKKLVSLCYTERLHKSPGLIHVGFAGRAPSVSVSDLLAWLFVLLFSAQAQAVSVERMRVRAAPDHTRFVFDLSGPVEHRVFALSKPDRLVLDIKKARMLKSLPRLSADPYIKGIRSAAWSNGDLRIVFDLRRAIVPKSFLLKPTGSFGHRLVLDIYAAKGDRPQAVMTAIPDDPAPRDVFVAIDAGHGGEDPGAQGPHGVQEKQVVLRIARELARQINAREGMRAVLVRDGDYYLSLRKRMQVARKHGADLFVSIHADAFKNPRARGSSVYVVSRRGASSEAARWLAEKENAADLVGGVSLGGKDPLLASVLLDLSQSATLRASTLAAREVFNALRSVGKIHGRRVQKAGFMVLKSPDIPSMLIETAFISNPEEERKLNDPAHQKKLAAAILKGISRYFDKHTPEGTLLARRKLPVKHRIRRGETLSGIAARYAVSLDKLRLENRLRGDRIVVGQILRIPKG